MKLRASNPRSGARRNQASVLIVVLWISIGLVSIALYFANSMTYELRAADNRASGYASEQAIEGAARYVAAVLTAYATNGAVPLKTQYSCEAVPLGESHYWIIGRDPDENTTGEPYFALIDEGSKLNLNRVGTNTLSYLPNMTLDFAQAIVDWRSTNNSSSSLDYSEYGYEAKQAPFETVDELRLVEGATVDELVGDDLNRNGVLDANEKTTSGLSEGSTGLFDYVTVYSREPNFHSDGSALTNVNSEAQTRILLQNALGSGRGNQVISELRGLGYYSPLPNAPTFPTLLRFYIESGMTTQEFLQICDNISVVDTNTLYTTGRVNVNTAGETVLTTLFMGMNIDQNTAQGAADTLISYRELHPDVLDSISWIVDALGDNNQVIRALETRDLLTTHSFQFTADIAAVGPMGRGYRRVKFIFDLSEGSPKILYRQDLSRLGWALGEKARQTYVAMQTK